MHMKLDEAARELRSLAGASAGLKARNQAGAGIKGMYLGALYGLYRATELQFRNRTGSSVSRTYRTQLTLAFRRLAAGAPAVSGDWLAGFYFNDSLFRLAAFYERGLRIATGASGRPDVPCLRALAVAKRLMSATDFLALDQVRRDVNDLKHRDGLVLKGRSVDLNVAVNAAREAKTLLKLAI